MLGGGALITSSLIFSPRSSIFGFYFKLSNLIGEYVLKNYSLLIPLIPLGSLSVAYQLIVLSDLIFLAIFLTNLSMLMALVYYRKAKMKALQTVFILKRL